MFITRAVDGEVDANRVPITSSRALKAEKLVGWKNILNKKINFLLSANFIIFSTN